MTTTILTTLTVTYRGTPLGRTSLVALPPPKPARLPPALREKLLLRAEFGVDGFQPLPGYVNVREIVVNATLARAKFGYLGPVDDPESDRRGREAKEALSALEQELEFSDESGNLIPVHVTAFSDRSYSDEGTVSLGGLVDEATASVYAHLRAPGLSDSEHDLPAD
jgi:hypothetical protein